MCPLKKILAQWCGIAEALQRRVEETGVADVEQPHLTHVTVTKRIEQSDQRRERLIRMVHTTPVCSGGPVATRGLPQ